MVSCYSKLAEFLPLDLFMIQYAAQKFYRSTQVMITGDELKAFDYVLTSKLGLNDKMRFNLFALQLKSPQIEGEEVDTAILGLNSELEVHF
jgi:hypothetical protein